MCVIRATVSEVGILPPSAWPEARIGSGVFGPALGGSVPRADSVAARCKSATVKLNPNGVLGLPLVAAKLNVPRVGGAICTPLLPSPARHEPTCHAVFS